MLITDNVDLNEKMEALHQEILDLQRLYEEGDLGDEDGHDLNGG